MGAHLVSEVLTYWTHLSDRAFRVLIRMALTALDNPKPNQPAGIYHGGRELLSMSLKSKGGTKRTRYRSVAEAVAELTEAGAIEHLLTGWAGQKAVYRLNLDRSNNNSMGGPEAHPEDGPTDHPMDVPGDPEWMGPDTTPRNQEDLQEELSEEEGVDLLTPSHAPRATPMPTPEKCPTHHIRLKPRTDGLRPCPLCRAGAPPSSDELATVTPINSRRAS